MKRLVMLFQKKAKLNTALYESIKWLYESQETSQNGLEFYAYNPRNTLQDERVGVVLLKSIKWFIKSQEASKNKYKSKKIELEEAVSPIIMKSYQQTGDTPSIY